MVIIHAEAHPRRSNATRVWSTLATHTNFRFALLMFSCLFAFGCRSQSVPHPDAREVAGQIHTIIISSVLPELHWSDFSDYRQDIQKVYEATHYAPVWVHEGRATSQALAIISVLESSQQKGLNPEDYDASLWPVRLNALKAAPEKADTVAHFDAALTVCTIRYLSNLRIGRMNPSPRAFEITLDKQHYDLSRFLAQKVLTASNLTDLLSEVEPQYLGYKRTLAALHTYQDLATQDRGEPLPDLQRTVAIGDAYANVEQLGRRLHMLGDLSQSVVVIPTSAVYEALLVKAVKHFQVRHGLKSDGRLDKETLRQLNTPLSTRVMQLEDSLERWRWLPSDYPRPPVMVNIPGFRLRVFSDDHNIAMRMNVVVGQAFQHQTPVFAKEIKYIIFRPYWNVPLDITRVDIIPKLHKDPRYLARKGFEVTDQNGHIASRGAVNTATLAQLQSGRLMVRQKPGPSNSLGLVKFMFPNEYDVYLHSTPAPQLFKRSRRDFSHGCIRVEKPAELAAWLLQDQPKWTLENIKAAMQSGPDNQQVNLSKPVPVVIVYLTAVVEENDEIYFVDDIYGYDHSLNNALAKGQYSH